MQKNYINININILQITKKILLLAYFILFVLGNSYSQDLKVSIATDKKEVLIGDYVELTLNATWTDASDCRFPTFADTLGKWDVISISEIQKKQVEDQKAASQKIIIAGYDSAFFTIPQLPFKVKNKTVLSDSLQVLVKTVPVDTSKQIMPIADIISVPNRWYDNWYYFIPVLLILLGLGLYFYFKNRKKKPTQPPVPKILKKPHEFALENLQALYDKQLWQAGENKLYYIELTDILRTYIEDRFQVSALELTTDELMYEFNKKVKKYNEPKENLKKILLVADMVKFAKMEPQATDNEAAFLRAKQFINDTIPAPVVENVSSNNIQKKGGKR